MSGGGARICVPVPVNVTTRANIMPACARSFTEGAALCEQDEMACTRAGVQLCILYAPAEHLFTRPRTVHSGAL